MIRFPNCKINIGLSVEEKRADGYHNIETVFYPLAVEDALEAVPSPDGQTGLYVSGNCMTSVRHEGNVIASEAKQSRANAVGGVSKVFFTAKCAREAQGANAVIPAKAKISQNKSANGEIAGQARNDGYTRNDSYAFNDGKRNISHNLNSIDSGLLRYARNDGTSHYSLLTTHYPDASDNLVLKSYTLLSQHFPLPPVHFHLHKVIPTEAGLGGGSSDAACTLKMMDEMFQLSLSKEQLHDFAGQLGADCPFFIDNIPVFATGKGEVFQKIELDLSGYKILVIKPPCSVGTKEAYSNIVPKKVKYPLSEAIKRPVSEWKNLIFNDFETFAFAKHPEIKDIKDTLYEHGALYAAMSGSGSAVYGIFDRMPQISFPENYTIFQI